MATETRARALDRLRQVRQVDGVLWPDGTDVPRYLHGRLSPALGEQPEEIVQRFIAEHGAIYGIASQRDLQFLSTKQDTAGNRHVKLGRRVNGLRIYPSRLSIWIDPAGTIVRVKANWPALPKIVSKKPKVDLANAVKAAGETRKRAKLIGLAREASLEYRVVERPKKRAAVLAWNLIARFDGGGAETEGFIIDANSGKLIGRYNDEDEAGITTTGTGINNADETANSPTRTLQGDDPGGGAALTLLDTSRSVDIETRDMVGAESFVGAYDLCADDDGDGVFTNVTNAPRLDSDRPEVDAQYNTGLVHDYLARAVTQNGISLFGRDGWKDDPAQIWTSLVHYGTDTISSWFSRSAKKTKHGDGDGESMTYKSTLDTCGHEWMHGVQATEITGGTNPNGGFDSTPGENFVVQEAFSDLFACCINRQWGWRMGPVFEDDASIPGATHADTGGRLRGLRNPSDFGQPDHYYAAADTLGNGFAGTSEDYTRIGILDKAGWLISSGGTHPSAASDPATYPPIAVYGIGVSAFENILYYAMTQLSDPDDVFIDFRTNMIDAANALYPADPCKATMVERAFDAVGIYAAGTTPPPQPSGPDPMITPWGARTDVPPYWQSPDIYVKDAADVVSPPLKGQVNRLVALITNIGDAPANGVQVSFAFAPYGAGASNNAEKFIGTVSVDVRDGTAVDAEIAWDLTDLTDTNSGRWSLPLGELDHFCVRVRLAHPDDVDTCNNFAQNNFGDVGTADSDGDGVAALVIANAAKEARWVALVPHHLISKDWVADLDLKSAMVNNTAAIQDLVKDKRAEVPWLGAADGGVVLALRGGEMRPVKVAYRFTSRKSYDGPIAGCVKGRCRKGKGAWADLAGEIDHLVLAGKRFKARFTGRILKKRGALPLRGELAGTLDPKKGKLEGKFVGVGANRRGEQRVQLAVTGDIAARATISFAVMNREDFQGLDLSVTVIGDPASLCSSSRCRPQKKTKR